MAEVSGLAVVLYAVTKRFPASERYAMTSQIQRAGASIPSNIAEGRSKRGAGNYLNHLSHARGSLSEVETLLTIAHRVGYIDRGTFQTQRTDEVGRMLQGLSRAVAAGRPPNPTGQREESD